MAVVGIAINGSIGLRTLRLRTFERSQATARAARCEMLEKSGWLTADEIAHPAAVSLSRIANLEIEPASLLLPSASTSNFASNFARPIATSYAVV